MNAHRKKVLIVDDEPNVRTSLELLLKTNFEVVTAEDGAIALELVESEQPDLVLLDIVMPNLDGMETLKQLAERNKNIPVIMLTATNTVKTAVQAMKYGAVDYLNKPFDVEELTALIFQTIQDAVPVAKEQVELPKEAEIEADFGPMIGSSGLMSQLFQQVKNVADSDTTILVTGESGTGKELIARRIHDLSPRKSGPFVPINCAAIPETLIESELFGHEKGAFTNAVERRIGFFELADSGTLFLDEIGELSLPVQVKLLRFLQEQEFCRVGSSKPIRVNLRVVCATNQNLESLMEAGKFREDLYFRINVINLSVPPLRDRFEDIVPLAEHFVKKFGPVYGDRALSFTKGASDVLKQYDWTGNVRELENVIESLMALAPNDEIQEDDLPPKLKSRSSMSNLKSGVFEGDLNFEEAEKIFETEMIVKALKKTDYVQTKAAELLGISRRILKYKMDKLGISDKPH